MSKFSDHTKPQIDITQYLPEVYRSEVNKGVFQNAFNRVFTKDDTRRVAGFIGEGNPQALRNRQIVEETPHRQAYQLAPTMFTQVGTEQQSLSFSAFMHQLELMGVDTDRFAKWGDTVQFNWVPPINLDMLVNYADYFWYPSNPKAAAQYITIENRCNKALSKVNAYRNILRQRGSEFSIVGIDFIKNQFNIFFKNDDLFVPGFMFFTRQSTNSNLENKPWTVSESSYSSDTNYTTITVAEPIIPVGATAPTSPNVGDWWYDTSFGTIKTWSGSSWVVTSAAITVTASLIELANIYQAEANCTCNQDTGWDMAPWDNNQLGSVVWNTSLLATITSAVPPASPQIWDLWYDVSTDTLKQRNADNDAWGTVVQRFSTVLEQTGEGLNRWDLSLGCDAQTTNQWMERNEWIHKTEVQSFTGIKRATLPILEYSSTLEMNEWVQDVYGWKYRTEYGRVFEATDAIPTRFELEPIVGFRTVNVGGVWYVYLFDRTFSNDCNIDYTSTFVPGYQFRVVDDGVLSDVYTVAASTYREPLPTDPVEVQGNFMFTVLKLQESVYMSPILGGGSMNTRIVPQQTSLGDVWRGYHVHWVLDETTITSIPCAPQPVSVFARKDAASQVYAPVNTATGVEIVGESFQELTLQVDDITTIDLQPQFQYSPSAAAMFGMPGDGTLRVYLNDIRQYGTYRIETDTAAPAMCVVGFNTYDTQRIEFATGITFIEPLQRNDVVRIEVGPAAQSDLGMSCVPIRTIEDEDEFVQALATGTQPTFRSLVSHRRVEQIKTSINQYPMFNVYNVITGEVVKAANIFGYAESSDYPINLDVQRRIITSDDGREFEFVQSLQDKPNGLLYGYRNTSTLTVGDSSIPTMWWYNPYTSQIKGWDGKAWASTILTQGSGGVYVSRTVVVAESEPTDLNGVENALWYNPLTNTVYLRNVIAGTWTMLASASVGGDPSLSTVWKCGKHNERAIPQYVDKDRNPVTIGSTNGDWQVPDQWMYNPEHHNRDRVRLSDLVTHFSTIIQQQPQIPGFLNGGRFTLTHDDYNYGVGGTVKEHNDGFDTLIAAVNVSSVTPVGVIEFAQSEYASSLQFVCDLFGKQIVTVLSTHDLASITTFEQYVTSQIVGRYQANEFMTQVYSDTSAYDATTDTGVKSWIATAPMFGLAKKTQPYISRSGDIIEIRHHDGHRSVVNFSIAEQDHISRLIVNVDDSRTEYGKLGVISNAIPPATLSSLALQFMPSSVDMHDALVPGVYWYRLGGGTRQLYRFQCYAASDASPPMVDVNGPLSEGTMYYNTVTETVYRKENNSWVAITSPGSSDVSPLWVEVKFKDLLAETLMTIEQQLYDVTPNYPTLAFDFDSLIVDADDQVTYDSLYHERFNSFVAALNIATPLVNTSYVATNPFTWNYASCPVTDPPRVGHSTPAACWQQLYTNLYGTPYPHLEPWCLQGYTSKPTWWEDEYADQTGTRRWMYNHAIQTGMWENIRIGKIPVGRPYPSGKVSTGNSANDGETIPVYTYFSVNISDVTIPGGYAPDAILPPYYDNATISSALPTVRSVYKSFSGEITSPDADYAFGDGGPVEWKWKTSVQYVYDQSVIAFQMQPVRFMHATFGPSYTTINGLQVETTFERVYSHDLALFHGDLYNTNQSYLVRGLNQWYVNHNRYTGYDTNVQFRQEWSGWTPRLTYQFGGIIDTSSFDISTKYFDINAQDYEISLINNGVVSDAWIDAFNISLLAIPPSIIQYNNQSAWKFELDTLAAIPRKIQYYGVKSYALDFTIGSNIVNVMRFRPQTIQAASRRFFLAGDQTQTFAKNRQFTVSGSTYNNGVYTVASSLFEASNDRTRIVVIESIPSNAADGVIDINGVVAAWDTGDMVVLSSTRTLPAPLQPDIPYYLVRVGNNEYQLAETYSDALVGEVVTITSGGTGLYTASSVKSSFRTYGGTGYSSNVWYHYELDTNVVRTFTPPMTVHGFQHLLNIIDGYAEFQRNYNIEYGVVDTGEFDPLTGRPVDWQVEIERCIEWAYGLRASQVNISDRFQVSANSIDSTFTFADSTPVWPNGTQIAFTTSGTLPAPLIANAPYYVVNNGNEGTFKVSITANAFDPSMIVELTSSGSGAIYAGLYDRRNTYPSFELNPIRNNIWINTPVGVVADVVQGPYTDIRIQQTIFDQYSRPIAADKLTVFREDGRSCITMRPEVKNDVNVMVGSDAYNFLHFGGGHVFVEGYEHFLLFNNYTTSGDLIYDAFLGLNVKKFNLDYDEKENYSLRPTLGGFFLNDGKFSRNIEGSISDMRKFYDAAGMNESTGMAQHAHALIGYRGPADYLNLLNVNSKSQFSFYRGMLQTKGSINSIKAYINSRRFVDAKMDEFWAWKIADFGDTRPRIYPEIKLMSTDGVKDDVRLLFQSAYETNSTESFETEVKKGFQVVSFNEPDRWVEFPEQRDQIVSPLFLDAEITTMDVIYAHELKPTQEEIADVGITHWYNGQTLFVRVGDDWVADNSRIHVVGQNVYWKHTTIADAVRVVRRTFASSAQYHNIIDTRPADGVFVIAGDQHLAFAVGDQFKVVDSTNNDGVYTIVSVTTTSTSTEIEVSEQVESVVDGRIYNEQRTFGSMTTLNMIEGIGIDEFTRINAELIRFNVGGFNNIVTVFTLNPAKHRISPAKLVDKRAHTIVHDVPLWHPALGYHYPNAMHNIDIKNDTDPALYTYSRVTSNISMRPWNNTESGRVWLDTSMLGYVPYYDNVLFPNTNDRLYTWGNLPEWAAVRVYKWTTSTTPPSAWEQKVTSDANDPAILQNDKATGSAKQTIFRRSRKSYPVTVNIDGTLTVGATIAVGSQVLFTSGDTLPSNLMAGIKYTVAIAESSGSDTIVTIKDPDTDEVIAVEQDGVGVLTLVPAFVHTDWKKAPMIRTRLFGAIDFGATADQSVDEPTVELPIGWSEDDAVQIFINGALVATIKATTEDLGSGDVIVANMADTGITIREGDIVDLICPERVLTDDDKNFDPDSDDDGTRMVQWAADYEYSAHVETTGNLISGIQHQTYYSYWVEQSTNRDLTNDSSMSIADVADTMTRIPVPHFVVQMPLDDTTWVEKYGYGVIKFGSTFSIADVTEQYHITPVMYREAVIRNVASYITDDDRFVVRFIRDVSLRDDLNPNKYYATPKNKHEEWFLFRREQTSTIPHELWIRLTESMMGQKYNDSTIRVPALERELYDATYGTDTRYGLGDSQAFVDRKLAIATVLEYLQRPTNDFYPADIDDFFNRNKFDTPENIKDAMDEIYNTFPATHVNNIWFDALLDALSTRSKYKEIMKTSWIALHGIRVLEVGGLFDD